MSKLAMNNYLSRRRSRGGGNSAMDEEEFNQGLILPPLIVQLKKILDQYPDELQIIKELIQNAEDAGAREIQLLYDHNTYGQDPRYLQHSDLADYQGPALYAYNDALFTDDDWKGIRMLSQSVKQNDPLKIGYFGIGFKSIFHLTDLPCMLSGDKLGIIDPHQQIFPASSHCWNIAKRSDLLTTVPHQLEPFLGMFGCDRDTFRLGFYKGTLFRFPLRAKPSQLSSILCTDEKIQCLLESFEHDAHLLLLFLRNLERIAIYEREKGSKTNRLIFRAEISSSCVQEIRRKRTEFVNQVRSGEIQEKSLVCSYVLTIDTERYSEKATLTKRSYKFLVTNYYCGTRVSPVFKNLFKDRDIGFLPWVGTAMRLDVKENIENGNIYKFGEDDGHIFCFLPLPTDQHVTTGLPFHVHGFFALEQNRKYIKWPGSNRFTDLHMDKGLLWNQCMLREALPKCFVHMIVDAIKINSSGDMQATVYSVYRAFPDLNQIERRWESVVALMYAELLIYPVVFYSSLHLKEWLEPKQAIFNTLDPADEATPVISEILAASSVKIVSIPQHFMLALKKYSKFTIGQINANIVSDICRDVQYNCSLHWEHKMKLLWYFLRQSKFELLDGLELLPLANGGFDVFHFNPKKADRSIYIAPSEEMQSLLPGLKDDFLESDIDEDIKKALTKAALRGYTQLKVLDAGLVGKLLPRCLPASWLNRDRVSWNPHEFGHPPENWLESLWLFLIRSSPRDLSSVEGLPILPCRTLLTVTANKKEPQTVIELVPLSLNNVCLARTLDGMTLNPDVEEIVEKIGISVIDNLPDYIKSHPLATKHYIFLPSYIGVLKAIERKCISLGRDVVMRRILENTSPLQKKSLRILLSKISLYEITRDCQDVILQLPIFETIAGSGGSNESRFVSASKVAITAPAEKIPFAVSRLLLDSTPPETQALAKLLGIKQLNMAQLLVQIIFPDIEQAFYDNSEVQRIMLYVLQYYHTFVDVDKTFKKTLRALAFLPKGDMLLTPDRFYDPDHELLQKLFVYEENFPGSSYSDPAIVTVLREIGLRGVEDVEPEDLHECGLTIQHLSETGKTASGTKFAMEKLIEKSNALMEYLHRHKSRLKSNCSGVSLAASLRNICWVRSMASKPVFYPQRLSWYQQNGRTFYKPSEVATKQYTNLIGSVMPVISVDIYPEVALAFGWDKPPALEAILQHMSNAIRVYDSKEKVAFMETARNIYENLQKFYLSEVSDVLPKRLPAEWVWNGDGFSRPEHVVLEEPFMDLRPFMFAVSPEMKSFCELFCKFGVKQDCELLEVLSAIKTKYEEGTNGLPNTTIFTEAEVKKDLHICVCLLNELKSRLDEAGLDAIRDLLYLPVQSDNANFLKLAPLSQCTYTDNESLRQGYNSNDLSAASDESITLVHQNVPNSTSEALGVPTLMSKMLDAEELDYSFGQADSLTSRLNALLQEYTDGFAVPKELIQNADDAGATEVKFLFDERTNTDALTCLIDEGMRECHGPALWFYNNSVFSDEDFENIAKLNGATKENQTDKIGRFGLGFNAVYNVTDVPSFVSRHNIVIFDPHTTFLGKSIRNKLKPGLKLDMRRHRRKLRSLGNQFKPFNDIFSCDLRSEVSYPATLFRLPLRTRSQAARSEICQKPYDATEVRELFRMIVRGSENLLLFTQNVLKITLYHLPGKTSTVKDIVEIFHAEKRPIRFVRELKPLITDLSDPAKTLDVELQRFIRQSSILKTSTEVLKQVRKGMSVDRITFPDSSMIICVDSSTSIKGENFLGLPKEQRVQPWYVSSCMGKGECLTMSLQEDFLLPTAGIAVALQYVPASKNYKPLPVMDPANKSSPYGALFSYLPLPVRSGLPVHVTGSFAVASNRRAICEQNEDDKFDQRVIWNEKLMRDVVCQAYLRMLTDLTTISSSDLFEFNLLWPNPDEVAPVCLSLLKSFYNKVGGHGQQVTAIFSDGRRWGSIDNTYFLDCGYERKDLVESSLKVSSQVLMKAKSGFIVASLPDWVRRGLEMSEADKVVISRTYDKVQFFNKILLPNIDIIPHEDRDLLMLDALACNDPTLNLILKDWHCIPSTPNGTRLNQPTKLVDPDSSIAKLFFPSDSCFPFGDHLYARTDIIQVLRNVGMKQSGRDLSWDEIVERAHVIGGVNDRNSTKEMASILLTVMNEKLCKNNNSAGLRQFQQQLMEIAFIPAMEKPRSFPLTWKACDGREKFLFRSSELFPPEGRDLVGCVQYIADGAVFPQDSTDVMNFLRLGMYWKEPTLSQVLEQLDVISNPDTENYLHDNEIVDEIQKMCYSICNFLQEKCVRDNQHQAIHEALSNRYFILAHNRFLSPKQVAFNFSFNCAPYLYELPAFYKRNFAELLKVAGVRENFEAKDYVYALQSLHDVYLNETLDKDSLQLALQLVGFLNDSMVETALKMQDIVARYGAIYVPDARNVLWSASELCFNEPDSTWLPKSGGGDYSGFSHPKIPFTMSKQLGVNTRRQDVLKKHSRGIPFGQKEPLTSRLKRILSGYPCDKEILKELLQNADDAGASEISFIKDPRQHGIDKVFDQSWRPLQGPALCVYNNRPFTEADLEGIQRLGQGSKMMDPNKTGQYGVGFNCVYHLTDVPSFFTKGRNVGETLCIFDPHARYVPGATVEEPGRRYDDVHQLRNVFTDVFTCYLEDKFDLEEGTMFRFPLRNEMMARDSELSDQVASMDTVTHLFDRFKQEVFDCLLFVNNVTTISLNEIDGMGRMLETYRISVEMTDGDRQIRTQFSEYLKTVAAEMQTKKLKVTDIVVKDVSYAVTLSDNQGHWEKWMVAQRVGVDLDVKIPPNVNEAVKSGELALLPRGGVAAMLDSSDAASDCRASKAFCFLPLPVKTDLPVHINGHFCLDHEARRNLWQDDEMGLKTEWNNMLLKHVIAPTYVTILRRAPSYLSNTVDGDNVSMMDSFGEDIPNLDVYCRFFPPLTKQTVSGYWRTLMESVYQRIDSHQEIVLPVARMSFDNLSMSSLSNTSQTGSVTEVEWLSTNGHGTCRPYFDNLKETYREIEDHRTSQATRRRRSRSTLRRQSHEVLRHILLAAGFKLLKFPIEIHESFVAAGVIVTCVSPKAVIDFFATYKTRSPACTLPTLPVDISLTPFRDEANLKVIHEYCSQDIPHFRSNLNGLPFLLCEDGQLRQFSNRDKVFFSTHHHLMPGLSSMFIHHAYVGTIFKDADLESCDVFKRFDVKALANNLGNILSSSFNCRSGGDRIVRWNADNSETLPNEKWIFNIWSFLGEEFDRLLELQTTNINETSLAKSLLVPLYDWCLLPAVISKRGKETSRRSTSRLSQSEPDSSEYFLVPIKLAQTVLDYSHLSITSSQIRQFLSQLGVLELHGALLGGSPMKKLPGKINQTTVNLSLMKLIVSTPEKPQAVLKALEHAFVKSNNTENIALNLDESYIILKYFSDSVNIWGDDLDAKKSLLALPLHLTVDNRMVPIGTECAFLLLDDLPSEGMECWQRLAGVIFLRSSTLLSGLYGALECPSISSTTAYNDHLFKHFEYFSPDARHVHLEFLRDFKLPQLRNEERKEFLEKLSNLEFLPGTDGRLHRASDFFDPHHQVFKCMFKSSPSSFPQPPFDQFVWLDFMRHAGLQKTLSNDLFITFANQVAKDAGTQPNDDTLLQSRTLVSHVFKIKNLPSCELLEKIADIPFIPPSKVSTLSHKIFPTFCQPREGVISSYITFQDGIPEGFEVLVWSSAHLLPDWANPYKLSEHDVCFEYPAGDALASLENYKREIGKLLKAKETPSIDSVIEHIQNICSLPVNKGDDTQEVRTYMKMDVMNGIYKFLQSKLVEGGSKSELQRTLNRLASTPCIVTDQGQKFVQPKQIVINLYEEDQIIPYLYQAPTELGEFKKLFMHLGATLHATAEQFANVLENIHLESSGEKLHPNELRLAFKAVHGLFSTLRKHRHQDALVHVHNIYLPTKIGHMFKSTDIIFNDEPSYVDRIRHLNRPFLVDLSECKLIAENYEDLVRLLPSRLRPIMLTSVVSEVLEDKSRDSVVLHPVADKLKYQLNSKAFIAGLTRLIKNEHRKSGHRVRQTVIESIEQNLKKVHVYGIDKVFTYLSYDGERIPASESDCECFIDKKLDEDSGVENWNIYINKTTCLNEELQVSVSEGINRMSGGLLKHSIHYIQPILSCLPHSIPKVLDRLKVRPDHHTADVHQPTLPAPGAFIPIEDHHLLKEDFEEFEPGEYVGCELEDNESGVPTVIYAVIIEKIVDENFEPTSQRKPSETEHSEQAHRKLTQQYRINVGDERLPSIAHATDLYKFHRVEGFTPRCRNEDGSWSFPHSPSGGKKTPKGYRESFYSRSSIFEPDDQAPPPSSSARATPGTRDASFASRSSQNAFSDSNLFADSSPGQRQESSRMSGTDTDFQEPPRSYERDRGSQRTSRLPTELSTHTEVCEYDEEAGKNARKQHTSRFGQQGAPQFSQTDGVDSKNQEDDAFDLKAEEVITTEKVMEEVSDTLEEAWQLPEAQRKKIIKRLMLKWHPDKNIGNEAFATIITQHVQAELERLELGLPRPSHFDPSNFNFDPRNPFSGSTSFQANFANAYKYFFDQMNQRAKEHKQQRERYQENFSRDYKGDYNFDVPPTFSSTNPQPAQAKRFLKQAQEDLRAADNDYDAHDPAYEWTCFKAHQAAEKALKAAQFAVDAVTSFSHDLVTLAASLEDVELRRLAQKLQKIVGNSNKLYNPDPIDFLVIPHEEYTKEMACDSVMCAVDILERVKEFVELRDYN